MSLFDNKVRKELELTKSEFSSFVSKMSNTIDDLETMIQREHGSTMTYSKLIRDYSKIGDPYFNNIFVKKSIDKISANISGVSFDIVTSTGGEGDEGKPVPDNNVVAKLFKYINEDDSSSDFIFEIVRNLQRFGKAFIRSSKEELGGVPVALDVLDATKIKAVTDSNNLLKYWEYGKKKTKLEPEYVLFIRYKHPTDPFGGLAPGSAAIKEILQDFYAQVYNIKNFQNGAMGKGVWVDPEGSTLSNSQKKEAQFAVDNEFNKGVDGAGKTLVLKKRLDWVRTSETNRDLEFHVLLNKMRDDIYVAYDIPKVLFVSAETTFTNLEQAKRMFWTQTLLPIIKLIETSFNTNFFERKKLNYRLRFKIEEVPELQDDLNTKIDSYKKLIDAKVPPSISADIVGLELEPWEGWDAPVGTSTFAFSRKPDQVKELFETFRKQERIEQEKNLVNDDFLLQIEYQKSLQTMLSFERSISNNVKEFYTEKWKLLEKYIKEHPVKSIKNLARPQWIEDFKNFLLHFRWGEEFYSKVMPDIENIFNRGVYRSYWGIGANFQQSSTRAIAYLANRSLKLKDSPQIVKDSIINMLESQTFTTDQIAKEISKKWHEASITRAKLIARTETTAAFNGGRVIGMKEVGIKKKQWVHSSDSLVRYSHRISSVIPVDEDFILADGYKVPYPGYGDPAHACNCRCTVVSVL